MSLATEKTVSHETERHHLIHTVREADLAAWLEIGWISVNATKMPGWHVILWEAETPPVAPFFALKGPAAIKANEPWTRHLKSRSWDRIPTFVYVIGEVGGGAVTKIGIGKDVRTRLLQHRRTFSKFLIAHATWRLPTELAARDMEQLVIDEFAHTTFAGREWFSVPPDSVIEFIQGVIDGNNLKGVTRCDPDRAFDAPPELFEKILALRMESGTCGKSPTPK